MQMSEELSAKNGHVQTQGSKMGQNIRRPLNLRPGLINNTDLFGTAFSVVN